MVTNNAILAPERGDAFKKFVINSALLGLIDPVRGEPTKNLIEGHPDSDSSTTLLMKKRFLDSFALICSTSSSGKDTAAAVCMEQNQLPETILRVSRNRGLSQRDLGKLMRLLQTLIAVANQGE